MQYRTIGKIGVKSSILGFGCMRLPNFGSPDRINEELSAKLLHYAIDHGVNYVDTAWFYHAVVFGQKGMSEPFVGKALSGGLREKVLLATKLPQQLIKERSEMDRYLEEQLKRLQTDHLDFYLVHGLDGDSWNRMRDLGVREFMESAQKRGLIRFPAFSFHGNKADFTRIIDEYDKWSFAQMQYNYMDTDFQACYSGLRYAAEKGIGVVVMEPLKGGKLARNLPPVMQEVFDKRPEKWRAAEWALRYVWNDPGVSLLLSGMNEMSQVEENIRIANEMTPNSLTKDQFSVYSQADAALRAKVKADCTACRYCQPCEQGVEIPEILAAYNTGEMWGTKDSWMTGYARIKGKPENCIECEKCEEICPQDLPIRQLLKDTKAYFGG